MRNADLPEYPREIPRDLPPGRVLVHALTRPRRQRSGRQATSGMDGVRYWIQVPAARLERCDCGWAPGLPEHYRVLREA